MDSHDLRDQRLQRINDNYTRTRNIIIGALLALMAIQVWVWWVVQGPERPGDALMQFTEARVLGDNNLCPGEMLTYEIALHVNAPGVYDIDISVWRLQPPAMMIFSDRQRRAVFSEAADYTLPRQWLVPPTVTDPTTNAQVKWLPGAYERRHAVSTTSRSTEPSIVVIPFQIRGDCP